MDHNMNQGQNMPMSNSPMMMQMSFYWGKEAVVLFSGWPKNNLGMYILSLFFVFFLAMVAELLSNHDPIKRGSNHILGVLAQVTIYAFRISFIYLVMLAVMSFNFGIFIAAVAGHTMGFFIAKYRTLDLANKDQNGVLH